MHPAFGRVDQGIFEQLSDFVVFPDEGFKEYVAFRVANRVEHVLIQLGSQGIDLEIVVCYVEGG